MLAKLVIDGNIERTTGFGKNNFEITITDKGIDKIASGGYADYDESTLAIIDNEKAINKVIEVYNQAYSHSLTFDDFFNNHLQRSIDSSKTKELIISLHQQGILPGLPWDFVNKNSNKQQGNTKSAEYFTTNEVREMHRKVDEILDKISKLEELQAGQEILYNEMEEIKNLSHLKKKTWGEVVRGKLLTMAMEKATDPKVLNWIHQELTDAQFKLMP